MEFYAYAGNKRLGEEGLGSERRVLMNLKTVRGAMKRCRKIFPGGFMLYRYRNFYQDETFELLYQENRDR